MNAALAEPQICIIYLWAERSSEEKAVRLSVCQTRDCDKTEEKSVQTFVPYERYMLSPVRPSVCLSVTSVRITQALKIFVNVSTPFGTLAISDLSVKFLLRSSHGNGNSPSKGGGGLNARGVAKCSDFGPFEGYISKRVQDMI